jgi:hypothetical protein
MDPVDLRRMRLEDFCDQSRSCRIDRHGERETADGSSGSSGVAASI